MTKNNIGFGFYVETDASGSWIMVPGLDDKIHLPGVVDCENALAAGRLVKATWEMAHRAGFSEGKEAGRRSVLDPIQEILGVVRVSESLNRLTMAVEDLGKSKGFS